MVAERDILLAIALCNFNGVVDIGELHCVIGDVLDRAASTAALQVAGEGGRSARPDFDACAIRGVGHADVEDIDVLDDVNFPGVLAETAD